jgi:hypothetical protein
MALYTIQDFIITVYTSINVITIHNEDIPNPHAQYRCAVAIETVIKVYTRRGREKTILNTRDGRQRVNSYGNNYILNYINKNNRQ